MRIGHYAPHIWAPGGIATYVRRLGTAQSSRGHDVTYLSFDSEDSSSGDSSSADAPPANATVVSVASEADLFRRAKALELDVLHLHKPVSAVPEDALPLLRTMHGHQASCPSGSRFLARTGQPCNRTPSWGGCLWGHVADRCGSVRPQRLAGNFARLAHEVDCARRIPTVTVSSFLRDRMIEAGCPPERLQTVHSPAPVVASDTPMDRSGVPRFLFLGRLVPQKGILWLLRSFAAMRRSGVRAHLDVAGDGDLASVARAFVTDHELADCVTFHGWVGGDGVQDLIRAARAVVFPSVWHEPAGLVSLEAAAHGRALIASRVGGIPEYATDDYAVLVPPNDGPALTRAMTTLAEDAALAASLGRRGRGIAQTRFTMDTFLDEMDTVYHSLADSARPVAAR
jgi:glycosyltransferase involved in cell wall biosynthesis